MCFSHRGDFKFMSGFYFSYSQWDLFFFPDSQQKDKNGGKHIFGNIYIYKHSKKKDVETRKCNVRDRSENIHDMY